MGQIRKGVTPRRSVALSLTVSPTPDDRRPPEQHGQRLPGGDTGRRPAGIRHPATQPPRTEAGRLTGFRRDLPAGHQPPGST
jgi:hypothetical protein